MIAEYGRSWNAETRIAYEIERIEIDAVRIDGGLVEFEVVEAPEGSEAHLGRYAQRAIWFVQGLPQPTEVGEVLVEVEYRLWAEPGQFAGIGPLVWEGIVRVTE